MAKLKTVVIPGSENLAPIEISSDDLMNAQGVPFMFTDFPVTPPMNVFLLWVQALVILREDKEIHAFMMELGKDQPLIPDLALDKPYLPNRLSWSELEQAIFSRFPDRAPLIDFIGAVPAHVMMAMELNAQDKPFFDKKREAALDKAGINWVVVDLEDDLPIVHIDLGDYYV